MPERQGMRAGKLPDPVFDRVEVFHLGSDRFVGLSADQVAMGFGIDSQALEFVEHSPGTPGCDVPSAATRIELASQVARHPRFDRRQGGEFTPRVGSNARPPQPGQAEPPIQTRLGHLAMRTSCGGPARASERLRVASSCCSSVRGCLARLGLHVAGIAPVARIFTMWRLPGPARQSPRDRGSHRGGNEVLVLRLRRRCARMHRPRTTSSCCRYQGCRLCPITA